MIGKGDIHGQYESINEDIPALVQYIITKTNQNMHIVSHSWGGVLVASSMVRYPNITDIIYSTICFGTKRQIHIKNAEKFFKINIMWNLLAPILVKYKGYLDAKAYNFGSDNETLSSIQHSIAWVNKSEWKDPLDGFDYAEASKLVDWPATWHITGINDHVLGHVKDVSAFVTESHNSNAILSLLSKRNGNSVDYNHIDILTHPLAVLDHFPKIASWLHAQVNK